MKKEFKDILIKLIEKEFKEMKKTEKKIEFPSPDFIKSREIYEQDLKKILKELE